MICLRIDVSYVSGLFAELRFYSCRRATWSICTFCTACVRLEEFFRLVCSSNCTIFLFDRCMRSRFQKLYRSHFGSRYKLVCCGHASLMEMVGVFDSCCCRRTPFLKKAGKPFRIDVSYVSGLFAELRFYSCRWATLSICKFCTACVCLEQFFRSVCSGNGTIYQLHK